MRARKRKAKGRRPPARRVVIRRTVSTVASAGGKISGFKKDSPLEITRAAAEIAGRLVLEAGLRQCARGKHIYPDPEAGYGKCSRCGRMISRRARRDPRGGYKLNSGRIH